MSDSDCTVVIDGKTCEARRGETLLAVAQHNNIFIPALCAHPPLQPYGACRLCLVEIEQNGRRRNVASCAYPAEPNLVVRTSTEQINRLRRGIMELLLARCPGSDVLRDLGARLGVTESRFVTFSKPEEMCILCGLCVRLCHEVIGADAISFANRGMERCVDSPFSLAAEDCVGCGACAAICPTGVIRLELKGDTLTLIPFHTTIQEERCISCRKPIAPVPLLDYVRTRAVLPLISASLCPDCRAQRRAEALAAVTAAATRHHAPA